MCNRLLLWTVLPVALLASSSLTFAQVYGTTGAGAPGAWSPEDLPRDLSAPKPFDPHDLSGVWASPNEQEDAHWLGEHGGQTGTNGPDFIFIRPILTPWGQERLDSHLPGGHQDDNDAKAEGSRVRINGYDNDPVSTCDPLGFPHAFWAALDRPFEFIPAQGRVLMHIQYHEDWRQIWTDGRSLPKHPEPAWNGYSVGHWDGDTFVVESTGYDERAWFDRMGDPRSSEAVLEERWHRKDIDELELQMTLTDPQAYMKPWKGDVQVFKRQKFALYEEYCVPSEEKFFQHNQRDVALGSDPNKLKK